MDSGNSGSMQSSSGDEEYDSRSESAAPPPPPPPQVFLNPHHYHYQNQQPPPPPPAFFDNIHPLFQSHESQHNTNPNSFLNLDFLASTTNNNNNTVNVQGSSSSLAAAAGDHHHHHHHQGRLVNDKTNVVIKNPKKRTRTSRRAPTTVLTTDTSNFRAMVQEFTGIPSQPFSVGSSPYSRRLDLFKSSGNYNLESMGPLHHPTRPAAINFAAAATTTTSQDMLNNFMQQNFNHPLNNVTGATFVGANKSHASNYGVPPFENHHHLAMSHAHLGILPNQDHLRSFDGHFGNSSQRVTSCKLNYAAASSDFHHDKNLENVSSRGTEGTVDSWICPSD